MKVGMLTTWQTKCGIATYSEALLDAMKPLRDVEFDIVPITPGILPLSHYEERAERLNACDVVHIQHEYGFWGGYVPGKNRYHTLRRLIRRPVVLTGHTTTRIERLIVPPPMPEFGSRGDRLRTRYRRARMRMLLPVLYRTPPYRRWIEASPFRTAQEVIIHTTEARDAIVHRGVPAEHVHLLPAGIPEPLPAPPDGGESFRKRFRLGNLRLITVFGYVTPYKGYELVLSAMERLPKDVGFVIAGGVRTPAEEPYAAQLQERVDRGSLADRVVITGFLNDPEVAEAMTASEIVAVPHTVATGSYSVATGISYGRPIIASDLACFRDIASESGCVQLFPSGDAGSLAAKLETLLSDAAERERLSRLALDHARSHTWRQVAETTRSIYESALRSA